jgi:hypothetical protein
MISSRAGSPDGPRSTACIGTSQPGQRTIGSSDITVQLSHTPGDDPTLGWPARWRIEWHVAHRAPTSICTPSTALWRTDESGKWGLAEMSWCASCSINLLGAVPSWQPRSEPWDAASVNSVAASRTREAVESELMRDTVEQFRQSARRTAEVSAHMADTANAS